VGTHHSQRRFDGDIFTNGGRSRGHNLRHLGGARITPLGDDPFDNVAIGQHPDRTLLVINHDEHSDRSLMHAFGSLPHAFIHVG
jgi:predicted NAD/FAD-binding protein